MNDINDKTINNVIPMQESYVQSRWYGTRIIDQGRGESNPPKETPDPVYPYN